jgi:hypothetical protein
MDPLKTAEGTGGAPTCSIKHELNSLVTSCNKARQSGDVIDSIAIAVQAGHILVDLVKHEPNFLPLDRADHILIDLDKNRPILLSHPVTSRSHFSQLGQS